MNRTLTGGESSTPWRDWRTIVAGGERRVVMPVLRDRFAQLLASTGVTLDGERPHDLRVHDERVFRRAAFQGALGLAEAYVDGWWDCARLDELSARLLGAEVDRRLASLLGPWAQLAARVAQLPRVSPELATGPRSLELGADLFCAMLDARRIGTCAHWRDARTLDEAQWR